MNQWDTYGLGLMLNGPLGTEARFLNKEVTRPGQKWPGKWQKQCSRNWKCLHPDTEVALEIEDLSRTGSGWSGGGDVDGSYSVEKGEGGQKNFPFPRRKLN